MYINKCLSTPHPFFGFLHRTSHSFRVFFSVEFSFFFLLIYFLFVCFNLTVTNKLTLIQFYCIMMERCSISITSIGSNWIDYILLSVRWIHQFTKWFVWFGFRFYYSNKQNWRRMNWTMPFRCFVITVNLIRWVCHRIWTDHMLDRHLLSTQSAKHLKKIIQRMNRQQRLN